DILLASMESFLHFMESVGVSVSASQVAVLSSAYDAEYSDSHLRRSIDELPLVWRAANLGRDGLGSATVAANIARRSLFGLLELAHSVRLERQLKALKSAEELPASALATTATLADGEDQCNERQEEELIVERDYHEALNSFSKQVRNLHSRLLLQGSPAPTLLCARPAAPLTEAEAALDRALVGLADRLFSSDSSNACDNFESDSDEQNCDALESCSTSSYSELQRVRNLHRQVLVERGRLAGRSAVLAEQCRRLRVHLDDPERTLSMAKTWLAEAKSAQEFDLSSSSALPDSTTIESAAAAAASTLAGQQEQRRLDRRLASLRLLAERQARLLDLLQRRRALHERLLTGQEAELARLRRLRSLLESSRRRLAEDEDAPTLQLRIVDSGSSKNRDGRLSAYLDRLSRLRARLDVGTAADTAVSKATPDDVLDATESALKLAKAMMSEDGSANSDAISAHRQRLGKLNSRLVQVKQRWAATHSGSQ
ncbi:hypothetical protein BOX15_Mlig010652g2, partial [Macrostomum lignano]